MEAQEERRYSSYSFTTSALDGSQTTLSKVNDNLDMTVSVPDTRK
jgi:hypothetical protein